MATQTQDDHGLDKSISNMFDEVPDNISTSLIPGVVFSDEEFDKVPAYTTPRPNDSQLVRASSKLLDSLGKKNCPSGMQYFILVLAENLAKPQRGQFETFLTDDLPSQGSQLDESIKTKIYASVELTAAQREGKNETEVAKLKADTIFGADSTSPLKTKNDEELVKNATFIAAFLLRILTKSVDNVTAAWTGMKSRFTNFYGDPMMTEVKTPGRDYLSDLKNLLASDPKIGHTWVKVVASAEHRLDVSENTAGMIRFLAVLPLSLTGMHAYKLFLEIKRQSNLESKWILQELITPRTLPALIEIKKILVNFEDRTTEKKSGKFRYARLMSPAFFQELQTKNCPDLVYVEVCILNRYEAFPSTQDPNKIIGIEKVPESMKERLKNAAYNIFVAAPQRNAGKYSTSMKKAFLPTEKAQSARTEVKKTTADNIFT
ncbi:N protein [Maize yellow striate virus]|uniref:Nucleoprotein n=1 Tax=Maize yellow striate virus TaxID=1168550 RepID=A0A2D1GTQ4_9RHAB|nr:N protein [Maize yellow striate virus]ATN96434.1 N protein [Maize yellow striate virus]ATN96444.1 nucleocapsid protein [Maize yellow striate virus]